MASRSDAATDRVSYTASSPPDPQAGFTFTCWAYLSVDRDAFSPIIRVYTVSGDTTRFNLSTASNGTSVAIFTANNTGGIIGTDALTVGSWLFIAATQAGTGSTDTILYTATPTGALNAVSGLASGGSSATGLALFGRSAGDGSQWLNGRIAYARYWSTVLTPIEIAAERTSLTPVKTTSLWASWPLTDSTDLTDHFSTHNLVAGSTSLSTEDNPPYAYPTAVTGTGTALAPTVTTGSSATSAPAGVATGAGTALAASLTIGAATGLATATGTAPGSAAALAVAAGHPAGAGVAAAVTASLLVEAGSSAGTAVAEPPSVTTVGSTVSPGAPLVAGFGAAHDPSVLADGQADQGSWYGLLAILQDAAQQVQWERTRRPVACPNDGEPLELGPNGVLHCRWDGWTDGGR